MLATIAPSRVTADVPFVHVCRAVRTTLGGAFLVLIVSALLPSTTLSAQRQAAPAPAEAATDRGAVGAGLLLRQLDGEKRVLMIGAHPDDEDTALLAALSRGLGAETAYLSLTRGDGGQNLIGPELGEGLGVVRTGELLSARSLDGGRQFFTRAFDYGYSKSAEEAFDKWPREELLRDVVWVVRSFRPQVIVSVFSGTPADGHGQHQAAGIVAREAFDAAGDPSRFPEQLAAGVDAWRPAKFYRRFRRVAETPSIEVETGDFDPLLGRSHFQIAMASRSRHRSQDMGVAQPMGPRTSSIVLEAVADGGGAEPGAGLFAGVDTALVLYLDGLAEHERPPATGRMGRYRSSVQAAGEALSALAPWKAAPHLAEALDHLNAIRAAAERSGAVAEPPGAPGAELLAAVDRRIRLAEEALMDAAGVVLDIRADDDLIVPGQEVEVEVELWNGGPYPVVGARPELELPGGWRAEPVPITEERDGRGRFFYRGGGAEAVSPEEPVTVEPDRSVVWRWTVRVPPDADLSEPYYLERPRDGAMYRWPEDRSLWALPKNPELLHGTVRAALDVVDPDGASPVEFGARRAATYVGVEPASGEYRTRVLVVPGVSVAAEPGVTVVPAGSTDARTVNVSLRPYAPHGATGRVRLDVPDGWEVQPRSVGFAAEEGQERSFTFTVHPPEDAPSGRYALTAVASTDEAAFRRGVDLIDYPHIERTAMLRPAETRVTLVPVAVAEGLHVGYVMGSGDDVPEALRQLGVEVDLLGPADVREGDLSGYDAIVTGIRAYETRPDLQAANERILDFARAGGTVLVQYNKYPFPRGDYAPYPVEMSRPHDRVTDEGSPFSFIHPDNPVFTTPNAIGPEDFEGWVTERGLYFLGEWDERMTPVLELTDPGEDPKRGSIVVTPLGEGLWVYTGLSFFRQLPEGVPGAYRLFANLVSLTAGEWRAWEAGR